MGKGAVLSGFLHLAVLLLAVFGLPWLSNTEEVLQATPVTTISAEQFAELQSKTPPAEKKQDKPKDQEIPPAPPAPEVAQPQPEPEEPAPPPAVEPAPPAPEPPQQQAEQQPQPEAQPEPPQPPQPEQQVIAPQPEQPKPEPVPAEEPKVAEAQPKPVPPKKPTPPKKKDEPKKKEEQAKPKDKPKEEQVADDSSSWLKNLDKKLKQKQETQPKPAQQAEAEPDSGIPQRLPFGEEDAIRRQIEPHWNYNPGLPGIEKMKVVVIVTMNPDGTVQKVDFEDPQAVYGDPNFRAFAESAARAVLLTGHLKMPPNRPYDVWRRIFMDFQIPSG
jgi:outer membrane biosynthesis protein TonB